ncbi:MAG: hypothetical protein H7331_00885 [Bacteroidia bacterium]|nr:hypothetical protein [Bacteroidia bacterium]
MILLSILLSILACNTDSNIDNLKIDTLTSVIYYENTQVVKSVGLLLNDKKIGLWKEFDKNGKLIKACHYTNDTIRINFNLNIFQFNVRNIEPYKISIKIPREFREVKLNSEQILIATKCTNCDSLKICPNFNLVISKPSNLKDDLSFIIKNLGASFDKFKVIDSETLNKKEENYKITYVAVKNNIHIMGVLYVVKRIDNIYTFFYMGDNEKNENVLGQKYMVDEIINSIMFDAK